LPPPPELTEPGMTADDEDTRPRDLPIRIRPPSSAPPGGAPGLFEGAFFALLRPPERGAVFRRFRSWIAALGTTVIRRGDTGPGLIVVARGRLEIVGERVDGARIVLSVLGPGEFIGETGLLAQLPATAPVIAATDCELLVLAADDFEAVLRANPALRGALEAAAVRRAHEHARRLALE